MSRLTVKEAKQIDLVDYLASLGFQPDKVRGHDYFYRSPLRTEKTASFKVNRAKGIYYDHGTGQGGTILDFGMAYFGCDISTFLQKLYQDLSFHRQPLSPAVHPPVTQSAPTLQAGENKIEVVGVGALRSPALVDYVASRKIPLPIAAAYCQEVHFELAGKRFYALGFKNDQGGFELRNLYFKGSSAPKASTFLDRGENELAVFEGFFNFLSFLTMKEYAPQPASNYLVLNSLAFFEKNKPIMERHEGATLYLDRDEAGRRCADLVLQSGRQYRDGSDLYADCKDLNEWLVKHYLALEQGKISQELARKILHLSQEQSRQLKQGGPKHRP